MLEIASENLSEGFSCERENAVHFLPDTRQLTCIFARILKMGAQLKMSGNLVYPLGRKNPKISQVNKYQKHP
jgi:hypothetical protein